MGNIELTIDKLQFSEKIIKNKDIDNKTINSLRYIDYQCLTSEQSKVLNEVVKKTLQKAKDNQIDGELALVYDLNMSCDANGDWLYEVRSSNENDKIDLFSDTNVMHLIYDRSEDHAVVISHNHQNNRIVSLLDLQSFVEANNIKILVAVTNSGKVSYIVKDNFNKHKFNEIKLNVVKKYDKNDKLRFDKYLVELLNRSKEYGVVFFKEVE